MTHRDPQTAFEDAIVQGRLNPHKGAPNYAGDYMYMGTREDRDLFKHIDTREYLP